MILFYHGENRNIYNLDTTCTCIRIILHVITEEEDTSKVNGEAGQTENKTEDKPEDTKEGEAKPEVG
jgi:hypothetical protein